MTEQEIAAYKEQMFGNGTPSTQSPTLTPPDASADNKPEIDKEIITDTPVVNTPSSNNVQTKEEEEIIDEEVLLEQRLGVKSWDEVKSAFEELNKFKEEAKTPKEQKFANEQSKLAYEALANGEMDKVHDILDTQKRLSAVSDMKPADAIKLHIQQNNKHYKSVDVEDVFEEKYSYPEKPIKEDLQDDDDYKLKVEKWEAAKEKIDRRIERDAATAKIELAKLSAEIKFPEIQKPQAAPPTSNVDEEKEMQRLADETKQAYSKIAEKDIAMVFKFNDEANKLAFDIAYEPDKVNFDEAKSLASDMTKFFESYYDKDGSPKRTEFLRDLYAGRNIDKIVSEVIVQVANQVRVDFLKKQKNIGDGSQRNFTINAPTEIDKLKQQVFG